MTGRVLNWGQSAASGVSAGNGQDAAAENSVSASRPAPVPQVVKGRSRKALLVEFSRARRKVELAETGTAGEEETKAKGKGTGINTVSPFTSAVHCLGQMASW